MSSEKQIVTPSQTNIANARFSESAPTQVVGQGAAAGTVFTGASATLIACAAISLLDGRPAPKNSATAQSAEGMAKRKPNYHTLKNNPQLYYSLGSYGAGYQSRTDDLLITKKPTSPTNRAF